MGRPVDIGPRLAISRDRKIDDRGRPFADRLVADTEPIDGAGPERFDEHVGGLGQAQQRLDTLRSLEVQGQAALGAMGIGEEHRDPVARGPDHPVGLAAIDVLDLDHRGAVIGHHLGQRRSGQEQRQIDHRDAVQLHTTPASLSDAISVSS